MSHEVQSLTMIAGDFNAMTSLVQYMYMYAYVYMLYGTFSAI